MVAATKARASSTRAERQKARHEKVLTTSQALVELMAGEERAVLMSGAPSFRAVPTIFKSFNRAATIGGVSLSNVLLLHGPSAGGKTALAMGLIASFQAVGGLAAFFDVEHSAETRRWFPRLVDPSRCIFHGRRPRTAKDKHNQERPKRWTYERIVDAIRKMIRRYVEMKNDGRLAWDAPLVIVVDSISKMVPKRVLESLDKNGAEALSSGIGRIQALLNRAWLADLGTLVADEDVLLVLIAHEMEESALKPGQWTKGYKVRGGQATVYDSMMAARVVFAGRVFDATTDSAPMTGKRHRVNITKNKHGPDWAEAVFYTSNGKGFAPLGFDRVREVVHEGLSRGLLKGPKAKVGAGRTLTGGTALTYGGETFTLRSLYGPNSHLVDAIGAALDDDVFVAEDNSAPPKPRRESRTKEVPAEDS